MRIVKPLFCIAAAALIATCLASTANAHFVWIETEPSGSESLIRSGFGEPDGWDPDLVDRMQAAKFWLRGAEDLKPLDLKLDAKEREYRGLVSGTRPASVIGSCDFGVIQLGSNPPSWLRYTAKSLIGAPKDWPQQQATADLRIELLATLDGVDVRLDALHLGKPLAGAKIKCTSPKDQRLELVTDADGVARWPLAGDGLYACYVGVTVPSAGTNDGKSYEVLKDYTTLTFRVGAVNPKKP